MQISDVTNLQGLFQDIDFRCSTDSTRYLLNDKIRNINKSYDRVVEFVIRKGGKLKHADVNAASPYNYEDYNLASGTADITITRPLRFHRAEVKDEAGNWTDVSLIGRDEIVGAVQEFEDGGNGIPRYITIDGDTLTTYPTPDYTQANSLRVYAQYEPSLFDSADTTETPALPRFAHDILSIEASLAYCEKFKPNRVNGLLGELSTRYRQLEDFLANQDGTNTVIRTTNPSCQ